MYLCCANIFELSFSAMIEPLTMLLLFLLLRWGILPHTLGLFHISGINLCEGVYLKRTRPINIHSYDA